MPEPGEPDRAQVPGPPAPAARTVAAPRGSTAGLAADLLVALLLAGLMAMVVRKLALFAGPGAIDVRNINLWLDTDGGRVFANVTSRASDHYRSAVHPLFSLLMLGPYLAVSRFAHAGPAGTVAILVPLEAALWMASLYAMLRSLRLRTLDAAVFAVLGGASASAMFLLPMVETYPLGSMSVMWTLTAALWLGRGRATDLQLVLASAVSLAVTTTNWMAGLLLALAHRPLKRAIQVSANAFVLVTAFWAVQKVLIPSVPYFLGGREDFHYVALPGLARLREVAVNFVLNPIVMPRLSPQYDGSILGVQFADPRSATPLGMLGAVLWVVLLVAGLAGLRRAALPFRAAAVWFGTLAFFFVLYLVYGGDTFLFSLLWLPILVGLAGLVTFTRLRLPALALALAVSACAASSNVATFGHAVDLLLAHTTPPDQLAREMALRPGDPWPRGTGHVLLAPPGTPDTLKGWMEPGGSFSPGAGSFGVSVWARVNAAGAVVTSDGLPMAEVRQALLPDSGGIVPQLRTTTSRYSLTWRARRPGAWEGTLVPSGHGAEPLSFVLRGAGPAAGPVRQLIRSGSSLVVNGRWRVAATARAGGLGEWTLGTEHDPRWKLAEEGPSTLSDSTGWAFARLLLPVDATVTLLLEDATAPAAADPGFVAPLLGVTLAGADSTFREVLEAQAAHLAMGVSGAELRPGDPLNYAFPWARDAAYSVVALARSGQVEAARRLAEPLLAQDFFGGFGAEADTPGLGIWALAEVAARAGDPAFEAEAWTAVRRKAAWIERFATATDSVWAPASGPVLPGARRDGLLTLAAEPAREGLVIGRMDNHRPVLYTTAASYRGLRDAAWFARRRGDAPAAARWEALSDSLRAAWVRRFDAREDANDRTYASALWPTGIATGDQARLGERLDARWRRQRDAEGNLRTPPAWSYFPVAEAHQWLLLGRGERVWPTLRWYWTHETSPGLHTWGEGFPTDRAGARWRTVRGAVRPGPASPHYWTAAEMLLLQLDMLACERGDGASDTLVIGAGVPAAWLARPFAVRGLSLRSGPVDWTWDGRAVRVERGAGARPLALGAAFPPGTPVETGPPRR